MSGSKSEAFLKDAKAAAGIDAFGNVHVLNTDSTGTLEVTGSVSATLTNEPTIDIGKVDQGHAGLEAWPVSLQGAIPVTNAELLVIPASTTEVLLLPGNIDTKTFSIYNNSMSKLYIKFGSGVSTSFFNFKMPPQSFYEPNIYTFSGDIYGVWDGTDGTALVSQLF